METRRWTNPSLPTPLLAATYLLYLGALVAVITTVFDRSWLDFFAAIALLSAAYLTANARSIGWFIGVSTTLLQTAVPLLWAVLDPSANLRTALLRAVLLPGFTFAVLVHPASRDYQRAWFN